MLAERQRHQWDLECFLFFLHLSSPSLSVTAQLVSPGAITPFTENPQQ